MKWICYIGFIILVFCLVHFVFHQFMKFRFDEAKRYSADAHNTSGWTEDSSNPMTNAMSKRHQRVINAISDASFPLKEDPSLVSAIIDGTPPICDVILDWLGNQTVAGVRVVFEGGGYCDLKFDGEQLDWLSSYPGLAKEISVSWNDDSCTQVAKGRVDIVEVRLLGTDERQISDGISPWMIPDD